MGDYGGNGVREEAGELGHRGEIVRQASKRSRLFYNTLGQTLVLVMVHRANHDSW